MARRYAKLFTSIWDVTDDFRTLSSDAQRLYLALVSQPHLTAAGVLPLQPRKWATLASDTTPRRIAKAIDELVATTKILVDEDTEEAFIRAFIRRDEGTRTPNVVTAIMRSIATIESQRLREQAEEELAKALAERMREPP